MSRRAVWFFAHMVAVAILAAYLLFNYYYRPYDDIGSGGATTILQALGLPWSLAGVFTIEVNGTPLATASYSTLATLNAVLLFAFRKRRGEAAASVPD